AEGIRHEFFGERLHELIGPAEQLVAQVHRAFDYRAVQIVAGVDDRARLTILVAPGPDGIEVLEREPDRIDDAVAGIARRIRAMGDHALAHGLRLLAVHVLLERFDTRRRCMRWRAGDRLENPGAATHGRSAIRVRHAEEEAALAEQAPAIG